MAAPVGSPFFPVSYSSNTDHYSNAETLVQQGKDDEAWQEYELGAQAGDERCMFKLGAALLFDNSTQNGWYWLIKGTKLGSRDCLLGLEPGRIRYDQPFSNENDSISLSFNEHQALLERRAAENDIKCIQALTRLFSNGINKAHDTMLDLETLPPDRARAATEKAHYERQNVHWTHRGADLGDPSSMHELGLSYFDGAGVHEDPQMGRYWLERSANLGSTESLEELMNMNKGDLEESLVLNWKLFLLEKRRNERYLPLSEISIAYEEHHRSREALFAYEKHKDLLTSELQNKRISKARRTLLEVLYNKTTQKIQSLTEKLGQPFSGPPPEEFAAAMRDLQPYFSQQSTPAGSSR